MTRPIRIMYTTEDANAGILLNEILDQGQAPATVGVGERGALEEAVGQLIRTVSQVVLMLRGQARTRIGSVSTSGSTDGPAAEVALDLGPTQVRVLYALSRGEQSSGELAKHFGVAPPAMVRIIDPLVDRGYIERSNVDAERRAVQLHLTEAGQALALAMREQFSQALKTYLSPLSEQQLYSIVQACSHLVSLLPATEAGG